MPLSIFAFPAALVSSSWESYVMATLFQALSFHTLVVTSVVSADTGDPSLLERYIDDVFTICSLCVATYYSLVCWRRNACVPSIMTSPALP